MKSIWILNFIFLFHICRGESLFNVGVVGPASLFAIVTNTLVQYKLNLTLKSITVPQNRTILTFTKFEENFDNVQLVLGEFDNMVSSICTKRNIVYFVLGPRLNNYPQPLIEVSNDYQFRPEFLDAFIRLNNFKYVRFFGQTTTESLSILEGFKNLTRGVCILPPFAFDFQIYSCIQSHFLPPQPNTLYIMAVPFLELQTYLNQMLKCSLQHQSSILLTEPTLAMIFAQPYFLSNTTFYDYSIANTAANSIENNANKTIRYIDQQLQEYRYENSSYILNNGTLELFNITTFINLLKNDTKKTLTIETKVFLINIADQNEYLAATTYSIYIFNNFWVTNPVYRTKRILQVGYYLSPLLIDRKVDLIGTTISGFSYDMIQLLFEKEKIQIEYLQQIELVFGRKLKNGSYTGLLNNILPGGKYSMAAFPVPLFPAYRTDFFLSEPLFEGHYSMLIKKKEKKLDLFKFARPYSFLVWIMLLGIIIVISVILFLTSLISSKVSDDNAKQLSIIDSIFYTLGSFLMAKMLIKPTMIMTQLFYILIWLGTLLIITSYVANLTVILIFQSNERHEFTTFQKLNEDKSLFNFVFLENSFLLNSILYEQENLQPGAAKSVNLQLYEYAVETWKAGAVLKADTDIEGYLFNNSNTGLLNEEIFNLQYSLRNCTLITMIDESRTFTYIYMFNKLSPFLQEMTFNLINARESGQISILVNKYFYVGKCDTDERSLSTVRPFDIEDISGIFVLLAFGVVLSFPLALIENVYRRLKLRHQRNNTGTPLQFGKVYPAKVTGLDKNGIYAYLKIGLMCCGTEDVIYITKENLVGKKGQKDVPSPIEQGITVGAKIKVKYLGNLPGKATRSFVQVSK